MEAGLSLDIGKRVVPPLSMRDNSLGKRSGGSVVDSHVDYLSRVAGSIPYFSGLSNDLSLVLI